MVLLCSAHHKLVHEGGYQFNRDQNDELFFRRPDGKAVPYCGYHRDDWIDVDCNNGGDNDSDIFGDTDGKNSRALGEFGELETEDTHQVFEQRAVYRLH